MSSDGVDIGQGQGSFNPDQDVIGRAELDRPPQTMQPPSRLTTRRIEWRSKSTGAKVSIVSAMPAGDVIARDDVFGMVNPNEDTMATTIGVVRFPGGPPKLCLSATTDASHLRAWRLHSGASPRAEPDCAP